MTCRFIYTHTYLCILKKKTTNMNTTIIRVNVRNYISCAEIFTIYLNGCVIIWREIMGENAILTTCEPIIIYIFFSIQKQTHVYRLSVRCRPPPRKTQRLFLPSRLCCYESECFETDIIGSLRS